MLTRDLTPCFVQDFGLGSRTGYEKALLVGLFDRTFTCLDVSVNGSCGDCVSADVTADAYIEDIKYCPFCGEEL